MHVRGDDHAGAPRYAAPVPHYEIDPAASRLTVRARSSIHDTDTRFDGVTGTIDADPGRLIHDGARAEIEVDMTSADAGDWLKNRKLRKDLDLASHPRARFTLDALEGLEHEGARFRARARGTLAWRGRQVEVLATGDGAVDEAAIDATARFDLDVTALGVSAPRFLMFRVEDVVTVEVRLLARTR